MEKCKQHHLFFLPLDNGHYKAVDTWCGVETEGKIWYCSEKCKEKDRKWKKSSLNYSTPSKNSLG